MSRTVKMNNAHVLIDGVKTVGTISEIDLPEIVATMQEHAVLGQNAKMELPTGIDPMEATLRFNSIYPEWAGKLANVFRSRAFQVRSSQDVHEGGSRTAELPFVLHMKATPKQQSLGSFTQGNFEGNEVALNVTYIKLVVNRRDVIEIDALNNIYKVDGVDQMVNFRANLGL